jgi:hypothetical protein
MKTPANRYHWISRNAFEPMLKALRTMALPALMSTAASTSQHDELAEQQVDAVDDGREFEQGLQGLLLREWDRARILGDGAPGT